MLICHNLQIIVINAVTVLNLKGVLPVDLNLQRKNQSKEEYCASSHVDTCVQFQLSSGLIHLFHRKQIKNRSLFFIKNLKLGKYKVWINLLWIKASN